MVEFNKVVEGLSRYINNHIYSNMNDWQEVLARIAVGRIIGNPENLKQSLIGNSYVRTFAVMDSEGNVDLEPILTELKREIERKGKITFDVPMFGKFTFVPNDIDELYREITGGIL